MTSFFEVKNLQVTYPIHGGILGRQVGAIHAVEDVSFHILKGETVGLVGESGCGKSTLGKSLLKLIPANRGEVLFENQNILALNRNEFQPFRKRIQMIFQDPYSSLNPRMRIGDILEEPFTIHGLCPKAERKDKVIELLQIVGLRPECYEKYPHEFSGGQRQRIGIARALAVRPDFIVADEPVSALDVSIQSQILNLLNRIQNDMGLTFLFISHDLNVIRYFCDRIIVMYLGRVMEILTRDELLDPHFKKHPYTEALLAAAPRAHPDKVRQVKPLKGDIPSPAHPPSGCVFHTRCPEAKDICRQQIPLLKNKVACHFRERDEKTVA